MPRLFVGTFLSEEGIEKLVKLSRDNQHLSEAWNAKLRWTDQTKLHITWVFLGEVSSAAIPDMISELKQAVSTLAFSQRPLKLQYDRFELWPSEKKARLAVITPQTIPDDVFTIDATIKKALEKFVPQDQRQHERKNFQPHITVLRFPHGHGSKSTGKSSPSGKPRNSDVEITPSIFPIEHVINEIALIESHLGKSASGYEKLAAFPI